MKQVKVEPFKAIGIMVRTSNENGKAAHDIGKLWEKFMSEGIIEQIPNKTDQSIISIYTNYQGDHTQPYDTILGCKVNSLENVPEGMVGQSFAGGTHQKFVAKGDLTQGVVFEAWTQIWQTELDRAYTADFEVYGEKAQNPTNGQVDIFVATK